ncbi:unnamed protein product [Hermetia illucens]|uniref:MD-2-related lipid-recognition domain-containing protein n=2 Tax=Hermetia illucens TaxID=343691 RepID=A0A7R8UR14_HERIL|nr:unnamed protein product [Hermetia illucens]
MALTAATDVSPCPNQPFPVEVRVDGCDKQPCTVVKGKDIIFEIDFTAGFTVKNIYTNVRATVFGLSVGYPLPDEQKYACKMLLYGSYCPIYEGEDVTYKFVFAVGTFYPEIGVNIEISLIDDDSKIVTCFNTDIKVVKGS